MRCGMQCAPQSISVSEKLFTRQAFLRGTPQLCVGPPHLWLRHLLFVVDSSLNQVFFDSPIVCAPVPIHNGKIVDWNESETNGNEQKLC